MIWKLYLIKEPKISTLHENSYLFLLSPSFGCEALMNPRAPRWWRKHLIYSISSSSLVYVFRWSDLWCTSLDRRLNVKHIWIFSEFSTVRLAYIIFMPTIHSPLYTFLLDHLLFFLLEYQNHYCTLHLCSSLSLEAGFDLTSERTLYMICRPIWCELLKEVCPEKRAQGCGVKSRFPWVALMAAICPTPALAFEGDRVRCRCISFLSAIFF